MIFNFNVTIHDDIDKTFEFTGTDFITEVPVDVQTLLDMKQEVFDYVLGNGRVLLGDFSEVVGTYIIKTEADFNYVYIASPNENIVLNVVWKDILSVAKLT